MKHYSKLLIELIHWQNDDIVTTSDGTFDEKNGEYVNQDVNWEE